MADLDLDAMAVGHEQGHTNGVCLACGFWPCPVLILVAEVRRLRAALDEAFDLDALPIPFVVNYLVDAWNDQDGYDPGDETEVLAALLRAIQTATSTLSSEDVLDLPRAGEADRG